MIEGRGAASMARNLTYLLGGRGIYLLTRFGYVVILARTLGPQIYGMINYAIAWYLIFLPLTRIGLDVVLSRDAGHDRQKGDRTAAATCTLRIVAIAAVSAVYVVLSILLEDNPASRLLVLVCSFALIGRSLALWTENVYTAYEINQFSLRQQAIFRPLEVVLGLGALFIWRTALPVIAVHGVVWCLEAAYGFAMISRHIFALRLENNFAVLRRTLFQGLPLGVAMLLWVLPYHGPLIFFRHTMSVNNTLGQLALALQAFILLSYLPSALSNVALPALSRSASRKDGKDRVFVETSLRFSLLLGGLLALTGTAFGPWFTGHIFGGRYVEAGFLIGPSLWLMIPWSAGQALIGALTARKGDKSVLFGAFAGAVFFSLVISPAVLHYHAAGAIGSAAAAMSLTTVSLIASLHKQLRLDLITALFKPALAVLLSAGVFYVLNFAGPLASFAVALVTLIVVCLVLACLTPLERVWLGSPARWIAKKIFSSK